jgi:hypothetical protein
LRGRTVYEKLPKTPPFGPSLFHLLRLLGSQQHPYRGVLLASFSTWGTENSLAEINLVNTGEIKDCNIILGQKLANTCSFVGRRIIVQQEKNLESRNPLSGSEELQSWRYSEILLSFLMRFDGKFVLLNQQQ